jgi:hypothetical protein
MQRWTRYDEKNKYWYIILENKVNIFGEKGVFKMIGLLLTEQEGKEMEYLIKRELEELLLDLGDHRIDNDIKDAMEIRYQILFKMLARFGSQKDCAKYIRTKKKKRLTVKKQI